MIEGGQVGDAAAMLDQYALLNPGDPKIKELREQISMQRGIAVQYDNVDNGDGTICQHCQVFIVAGLSKKRSGFYTSIYNKIRLLEERFGTGGPILTIRHDIDLRMTEVWLKTFTGSSIVMSPKTVILNVYEHYQNSYAPGLENKAVYGRTCPGGAYRYEKLSDNVFALYDGDTLVREDFYTGYSGSLRMERHYKNGRTEKEIYLDDWGYLNCVREYDRQHTGRSTVKYYTADEKLVLEARFDTKKDDYEPQHITLYDANGGIKAKFNDNNGLAALYLKETMLKEPLETKRGLHVRVRNDRYSETSLNNADQFHLLVFETGTVGEIAGYLEAQQTDAGRRNYKTVSIIHSIFLKNAYDPKSGPQSYYEYVCNNPGKMDGIVFLTQDERQDFVNMYGHADSTFVIPHPYPYEIEPVDFEERDHKKAIVISRFFPEKQIDVTIDIFAKVVKSIPEARLEIYGIGPEQENIEAYIKKLGMEKNIFMMGYTDDAISLYRTAALHIMTSFAEGFGLTLMESICNGCPAFSYDMKYGPADIIQDGRTGFLFPPGDKDKYARQIISYLSDIDLQREMSENCYADAPRFGTRKFTGRWTEMVNQLRIKNS